MLYFVLAFIFEMWFQTGLTNCFLWILIKNNFVLSQFPTFAQVGRVVLNCICFVTRFTKKFKDIFISRRALAWEGDYEMMPVCACVRVCVR